MSCRESIRTSRFNMRHYFRETYDRCIDGIILVPRVVVSATPSNSKTQLSLPQQTHTSYTGAWRRLSKYRCDGYNPTVVTPGFQVYQLCKQVKGRNRAQWRPRITRRELLSEQITTAPFSNDRLTHLPVLNRELSNGCTILVQYFTLMLVQRRVGDSPCDLYTCKSCSKTKRRSFTCVISSSRCWSSRSPMAA